MNKIKVKAPATVANLSCGYDILGLCLDNPSDEIEISKITENKIDIISNSPEVGEATETLAVDYKGDPLEICFNAQYILDFLSVADSESVALEFKDEMSQAIMRPAGDSGCDYTYVIMPMRV